MALSGNITLQNFLIFNPSLAKTEGEEEKKILYYYPADVDRDFQLKNAGLCEALIKFSASFHPDRGCEVFTTEKSKQMLFEPEPGYWMVMTVSATLDSKVVDSRNCDPSDIIEDNVYGSILKLAYRMFRLFTGSFALVVGGEESEEKILTLRDKLKEFYDEYLTNVNIENANVLDVFQGIQFLPLSREPFLHVQSFINLIEVKFPSVKHSMFLYNDHLVWSPISPEDTQVLYQYLMHSLFPAFSDLELEGVSLPRRPGSRQFGRFLTGPPDLLNIDSAIASLDMVPKVFLSSNCEWECYHLVVYRAVNATICLFIGQDVSFNVEFFQQLDEHIGPKITSLVDEISEYSVKSQGSSSSSDSSPRFIYFNSLNLAIKSSIFEAKKGTPATIATDVMRILTGLNAKKELFCDNGEIIVSTSGDTWIVLKFSNGRECYVIPPKKTSLVEIGAEVKKVCENQLRGIFFLD